MNPRPFPTHGFGLVLGTAISALLLACDAAPQPPQVDLDRSPGGLVVQNCAEDGFVDRRAENADRSLEWVLSIASDPERCILITVGQTVVWNGNFNVHPLDPQGGDTPNPIVGSESGAVRFMAPGTFGYVCGVHPAMKGAVKVVPGAAAAVPALDPASRLALLVLLFALPALAIGKPRGAVARLCQLGDSQGRFGGRS